MPHTRAMHVQLMEAATTQGFFYVRSHGVPQHLIDAAWAASRRCLANAAQGPCSSASSWQQLMQAALGNAWLCSQLGLCSFFALPDEVKKKLPRIDWATCTASAGQLSALLTPALK